MNYIRKVEIKKFWGDKLVTLNFGQNENFLIGVNGSGKTTIINIIVGVIEGNFSILERAQYDTITVYLTSREKNEKNARIVVSKVIDDKTPFPNILYQIFTGREKTFEIYLNDLAERRLFRGHEYEYERHIRMKDHSNESKDLRGILKKLFNTSWLSIHRASFNNMFKEERSSDSLVDIKLQEFSRNFTGYLNELNRLNKIQTDDFQKYIFLSLISTETENELYQVLDKIDLKKEKDSLAKIYTLFNIEKAAYQNQLENYVKSYCNSFDKRKDKTLNFGDAEYLIGMKRIHSVIQEWQKLISRQSAIFKFKDSFMTIINGLLQRKELFINERSELKVTTDSGKIFNLEFLSSGEKQLVIILGETLLQKSEPHIFIADEPELSLHVEWQEKLVSSLKVLNPYAQMIFATHSPDVVSSYQKSVIEIEKCIS